MLVIGLLLSLHSNLFLFFFFLKRGFCLTLCYFFGLRMHSHAVYNYILTNFCKWPLYWGSNEIPKRKVGKVHLYTTEKINGEKQSLKSLYPSVGVWYFQWMIIQDFSFSPDCISYLYKTSSLSLGGQAGSVTKKKLLKSIFPTFIPWGLRFRSRY